MASSPSIAADLIEHPSFMCLELPASPIQGRRDGTDSFSLIDGVTVFAMPQSSCLLVTAHFFDPALMRAFLLVYFRLCSHLGLAISDLALSSHPPSPR